MTIFLTTQYLEEADALADRVGIISQGRLVAEGTPERLKRTVGHDLIVVDVDGRGRRGPRPPPPSWTGSTRRHDRPWDDHRHEPTLAAALSRWRVGARAQPVPR